MANLKETSSFAEFDEEEASKNQENDLIEGVALRLAHRRI
jgi:hypothetical protein